MVRCFKHLYLMLTLVYEKGKVSVYINEHETFEHEYI